MTRLGAYEDSSVKNNVRVRRRANHLGYKFALRLCSREQSSSWRLHFWWASKQQDTLHDWRLDERGQKVVKNRIYSVDSGLSEEEIYMKSKLLHCYRSMFQSQHQGESVGDNHGCEVESNSWHKTSLVENKIQSKNLMILLTDVVGKYLADTEEPVRPIPTSEFEELLKPLRNVDWLDPMLKNIYTGGGEQRRSAMLAWMIDAVLHADRQNLPAISDVTSDDANLANKAGFAVMSAPGNTEIDRVEGFPPTADAPMTIFLNGPRNCWRDLKELTRLEMPQAANVIFVMDRCWKIMLNWKDIAPKE